MDINVVLWFMYMDANVDAMQYFWFLEGFECSFYLLVPDKGYVGTEQAQETVNGCGVIRNEASKKIGSPLQTLELSERSRRRKV